jgi:hypothetical protein
MNIRSLMTLALFVVSMVGAGAARAQPVPRPTPVPIVPPLRPITRDRPTWDDANRHIRVVASYDGRRINVLSAASGQGTARSYLSQRRDIVVVILNNTNEVVREFNLPDPLELRVREPPSTRPVDIERPRRGEPIVRPPGRTPPLARSGESVIHQRRAQFELFVPRLEGAKWLEFHKGGARGQLLGRIDLTQIP